MSADADAQTGLQFPLDWQGKILARADAAEIPAKIQEVLRAFAFTAAPTAGNTSSTGRYVTYTVTVQIPDRLTLDQLTYALSKVPGVRYVI